MTKIIDYNIKGIKCDAPACDYIDLTVPFDKRWLNAPCPKCGANLLTQEDYDSIQKFIKVADFINGVGKIFGFKGDPEDKGPYIEGEMNGTGEIKFNQKQGN